MGHRHAFLLSTVLVSTAWSGSIVINEIHFDPADKTKAEEFVELYNAGALTADLSDWFFSDGIEYSFPAGVILGPGEYLVIAEDPATLERSFRLAGALGPYAGRLANEGELLCLRNAEGEIEDEFEYAVGFPWPIAASGRGASLELINPSLDNALGGSWRASGLLDRPPQERTFFIGAKDPAWHYRKGTSEASDPRDAWRQLGFVEDETWATGQTSIGFGDNDDSTVLDDMLNAYTSVFLRHEFTVAEIPTQFKLSLYADDGAIVWINGAEVKRVAVSAGERTFDGIASQNREAAWEDFFLPNPASFLRLGTNVIAIHAFNLRLNNNDFSIDAQIFIPGDEDYAEEVLAPPTPGGPNSVFFPNAPPHIREVEHLPRQPRAGEPFAIRARISDPDRVAAAALRYQVVPPGGFIPAYLPLPYATLIARPSTPLERNPAFDDPAAWTEIPLLDDGTGGDAIAGDGVSAATVPGQVNRTIVRYRIVARDTKDLAVTVPYKDDRSLNFACFVYDGVPPYVASRVSVQEPGHIYGTDVMNALPVYIFVTRRQDLDICIAYNGSYQIPKSNEAARDAFNWEGAFVYEGIVYDHMRYRLRQANDRYGGQGKRSFRFRFNKGNYFRARDNYGRPYPLAWRTLNTGKMFDNKRFGNFGLTETMNHLLWNMVGVPAPWPLTFHFRVVTGADEVPAGTNGQYLGDFWGMALNFEDYDPRFLETHGMADGNLYKLKDGIFDGNQLKRNQGRFAVTNDIDFQTIRSSLRPTQTNEWLDANVNYAKWNPYHAVCEAVRHYDFVPADTHSKNRAWYFEPYGPGRYGRLWTLPWDSDASWGPSWNSGIDYSKNAIFSGAGKEPFKMNYRNDMREFRDLVWTQEVIERMIDDLAERLTEFAKADRDRWRGAPAQAGYQDFGTMEAKVLDMKRFAFVAWSGGGEPAVPAGGRAKYLEQLADAQGEGTKIPATPAVAYIGPEGYPMDALAFRASEFSDPQGDALGAVRWRIGEVTPAGTPFDPATPRTYEVPAVWEQEFAEAAYEATIPLTVVKPGARYRVRARFMDATGRWSHWSAPVEFTAGQPARPLPEFEALRITEVMYHPRGDSNFEFIEFLNIGAATLDLSAVSLRGAVGFSFGASPIKTLGPGQYAVVVRDRRVFEKRYDARAMRIADRFEGWLENDGETIRLVYGAGLVIQEFAYDDAWYPATDGTGYSLVIRDPAGPLDAWGRADGWRPSTSIDGSPGGPDTDLPLGDQLPGDISQDGRLTVSDAVVFLRHLVGRGAVKLPCGDGAASHASNRWLLDLDESGGIEIADVVYLLGYIFGGGPPPPLGTACIPLAECPDRCGS